MLENRKIVESSMETIASFSSSNISMSLTLLSFKLNAG